MSAFLRDSTATFTFVVVVGCCCLSACQKKPTEPDTPSSSNSGTTQPSPTPGSPETRDPQAPRSPVFGRSDPRLASIRRQVSDHLKMIGIALHVYHDLNGYLPGGFLDKTGKPGLSWRVAILPYIEQDALFRKFKLDEPWNSEHNKKLIDEMPTIYAPPGQNTNGYTFYRGFTGEQTWLPPVQKGQPGQSFGVPIRGRTLNAFTDGTSNSIVVAEAWHPVIWTKPDEMAYSPNQLPALFGMFEDGAHVLFGDGSVRFIKRSISPKTLNALITINGNETINHSDL